MRGKIDFDLNILIVLARAIHIKFWNYEYQKIIEWIFKIIIFIHYFYFENQIEYITLF